MKKRINLIPPEYAKPGLANKLSRLIKRGSLAVFAGIFLVLLSFGGYYVYFYITNQNLSSSLESLKSQILNLQASEQRLVLAKDRIAKLNQIKNINSSQQDVANLVSIFVLSDEVPEIVINEINIEPKKTKLQIFSSSPPAVTQFLSKLVLVEGYKNIFLTQLIYNPTSGYIADIEMQRN